MTDRNTPRPLSSASDKAPSYLARREFVIANGMISGMRVRWIVRHGRGRYRGVTESAVIHSFSHRMIALIQISHGKLAGQLRRVDPLNLRVDVEREGYALGECGSCGGRGVVPAIVHDDQGEDLGSRKCRDCNGTGNRSGVA